MTVQRFNPVASAAISLSEHGEYVKYEDYEKLAAKLNMINGLMDAAEQANKLAQEATEKQVQERDALAAENAGLKSFKTAVYQQMGAGCEAPEFSITEGLSNLSRFADTLHAIEREFFTKEVPDEECEGETVEECPLCWGMSVEHYVSEFRKCLAEVRASALDEFARAQDEKAKKYYELSPGCSAQDECQYAAGQAWFSAECIRKSAAQPRKGVQS